MIHHLLFAMMHFVVKAMFHLMRRASVHRMQARPAIIKRCLGSMRIDEGYDRGVRRSHSEVIEQHAYAHREGDGKIPPIKFTPKAPGKAIINNVHQYRLNHFIDLLKNKYSSMDLKFIDHLKSEPLLIRS